jgi:hypothetical protein
MRRNVSLASPFFSLPWRTSNSVRTEFNVGTTFVPHADYSPCFANIQRLEVTGQVLTARPSPFGSSATA